jgi:archaemetzincin
MREPYLELQEKLRPLAEPLPPPRPGDWLTLSDEPGQTSVEYLNAKPVRKSGSLHTIYLCLVGDFTPAQRRIIDLVTEYLASFFDSTVKVQGHIALTSIPHRARRTHPSWGDQQLLTSYILDEILDPERPTDALAYLALTAADLWPGEGWNFVFGQANLCQRTGVWSIYRNGDPVDDFTVCLRRTLSTASHELCHVLTMQHCTVFRCLMNGSNHEQERDARPLHMCPVCLRKLCWNLRVDPLPYFRRMNTFCQQNGLDSETGWYARAMAALAT